MPTVMYEQNSNKAPVAYQDVAAYFSEEEWKVLHDWQKELYSKVMNEVHQALISLGPLIASTVYTLRTKEIKDGCTMDHQDSDTRDSIEENHTFDIGKDLGPDDVFRSSGFMEHQNVDEEDSENSFILEDQADVTPVATLQTKEEVETCFMGDQNSNTTEILNTFEDQADVTPIVTFRIKEEVETYSACSQDSDQMDILNRSEDSGTVNVQQSRRESVTCPDWALSCKSSSRKNDVLPVSEKPVQSWSEMWSEDYQGLAEVEATPREISFGNPLDSNLNKKTESTGTYKAYMIDKVNSNRVTYPQQKCPPDMFPGYKKTICVGQHLRHMDNHPFKCVDCDKSFRWKSHLIRHQATHCEDKPFQCTVCPKRFSRNDTLITHQKTHTGELPFKCTVCMKVFRHNKNFVSHMAMHMGN